MAGGELLATLAEALAVAGASALVGGVLGEASVSVVAVDADGEDCGFAGEHMVRRKGAPATIASTPTATNRSRSFMSSRA